MRGFEGLDPHHLRLRAERQGGGGGRVDTILITATNSQGGVSTATTTVLVPHGQGGSPSGRLTVSAKWAG